MSYTSGIVRTTSAACIGVIAVLALSLPATAVQGGGGDDAGAARNAIPTAPPVDTRRLLNDIDTPLSQLTDPQPAPTPVTTSDGGAEVLQIALGAAGGLALAAGAAAGMVAHRRRHVPQTA